MKRVVRDEQKWKWKIPNPSMDDMWIVWYKRARTKPPNASKQTPMCTKVSHEHVWLITNDQELKILSMEVCLVVEIEREEERMVKYYVVKR